MSSSRKATALQPIAPDLWTEEGSSPQLLGGRDALGKLHFPVPDNDAGSEMEVVKLSSTGTLWSYTRQDFKPKPPYDGPEEFTPFLLGYIELPGEIIVESHIVDASLDQLTLGMPMQLVIVPFDETRSTFAFKPL